LLPQVGFQEFGGGEKAQNGDVTRGDDARLLGSFRSSGQQWSGGQQNKATHSPIIELRRRRSAFSYRLYGWAFGRRLELKADG